MVKQEELNGKGSKNTANILSITIESDVPACLDSRPLDRLLWSSKFTAKEIDEAAGDMLR